MRHIALNVDGHTAKVWLTWLAAAFELAGLGAVIRDIGESRRQAQRALKGKTLVGQVIRLGRALEVIDAIPRDGPELPTEKRLDRLEEAVRKVKRKAMHEANDSFGEAMSAISEVRNEAIKSAEARDAALRDLIAQRESSGLNLRVAGACSIAIGIVLAAFANLVGP